MNLGTALQNQLESNTGVNTLVGTRIYPHVIPPRATLPLVTLQEVSYLSMESHDGITGLAQSRYQVTAWAKNDGATDAADVVESIREKIRLALQFFTGLLGGAGGVTVQRIQAVLGRGWYEPEAQLFARSMDFMIWHEEPKS